MYKKHLGKKKKHLEIHYFIRKRMWDIKVCQNVQVFKIRCNVK